VIPIYSISKPFLAQAVLELGLPLDSAIGEHLPQLAPAYATRKIGALLNHTSGLADYGYLKEYHAAVDGREPAWPRSELLERCLKFPHTFDGFQYSNIGYLLLRMLVEEQTGLEYFEALEQLVFHPLKIEAFSKWEATTDVVAGYDPRWVYSGTFLGDEQMIAGALATLLKHRHEKFGFGERGLTAGLLPVGHENTGFAHPAYGYGLMADGKVFGNAPSNGANMLPTTLPKFIGHGGGGPGFGLMALVNSQTWQSKLEFATEGWNQTEAIGRLCAALTV
jgi:CubicO group peptidase (beta-lactamase class C family)